MLNSPSHMQCNTTTAELSINKLDSNDSGSETLSNMKLSMNKHNPNTTTDSRFRQSSATQRQFAKELSSRLAKLTLDSRRNREIEHDSTEEANDEEVDHNVVQCSNDGVLPSERRLSQYGLEETKLEPQSNNNPLKPNWLVRPHLVPVPIKTEHSEDLKNENVDQQRCDEKERIRKDVSVIVRDVVGITGQFREEKLSSRGSPHKSPDAAEEALGSDDENDLAAMNEARPHTGDNELDWLEDDKAGVEEVESAFEASDSEVSYSDQQMDLTGSPYPVIASLFPNIPSVIRFVGDGQTESPDWLGYFGNHLKPLGFRPIKEYQKVNHFPGSFQLGRKDKLWTNLSRLRTQFGRKSVDFVPRTFCLPCDARILKEVWSRQDPLTFHGSGSGVLGAHTAPKWIIKPPASARGIGIRVIQNWSDIPKQRHLIVQSYISRPFLINETKFDLRLYVYVTGFNPFRAYLHRDGLVRFASQKKLENLWSYFLNRGVNVNGLWLQLKEIIFKTLASVANPISTMVDQNCRRRACAHELFGFDVLLDENLKPWLLEVNVSPSLHTNTTLDNEVKSEVVTDMLNIAGFRLPPEYKGHGTYRSTFIGPEDFGSNTTTATTTTTTTSTGTNGVISDFPYSMVNFRSMLDDRTQASSISLSRSRTPVRFGVRGEGAKPPHNRGGNTATGVAVSATRDGVSEPDSNNQSLNLGMNPVFPVCDPRLWDLSLSWDERQKHMSHPRLMFQDDSLRKTSVATAKRNAARLLRANRSSLSNPNSKRSSFCRGNPSEMTLLDELNNIVSHLTPDDARTLADFMDERYRAALGNFEPVFPIGGDRGLPLLLFLEGCGSDAHSGSLGARTPTFHYYDSLIYAFLTVYQRSDAQPSSFMKTMTLDNVTAMQLPDYHMLVTGELSDAALLLASQITEVTPEGLNRLTEICKNGLHISKTDAPTQYNRLNQNIYALSAKHRIVPANLPLSETARVRPKKRTKAQTRRPRGPLEGGDAVETILGGAVSFRAQSSTPHPTDMRGMKAVSTEQLNHIGYNRNRSIHSARSSTRMSREGDVPSRCSSVYHMSSENAVSSISIRPVARSRNQEGPDKGLPLNSQTLTSRILSAPKNVQRNRQNSASLLKQSTYHVRTDDEKVEKSGGHFLTSQSIQEVTRSVRYKLKPPNQRNEPKFCRTPKVSNSRPTTSTSHLDHSRYLPHY